MKVIKKEIIFKVGDIELFDEVHGELVVGFHQENGRWLVLTREVGDEGGAIPYDEAIEAHSS